jgi:tripartite-type tricarboxylate transporter receptor subunit TctC
MDARSSARMTRTADFNMVGKYPNLAVVVAALGVLGSANATRAQPARTVKIVVASAPGGVNDILARLLGDQIGRMQGLTVVVDNRPGAGEVIGTEQVARAAPDGNTFLFAANPFVINPHLRKVAYDPLTSFEPICELATAPTLISVNAASPYRSLGDLLAAARAAPGALTMASIGPGSPFHLGFEQLKHMAKVDMTFVPFPGNGPSVNALLGGHVSMMFGTYANVAEHLATGKLRAIAATTRKRFEELPDLPTVIESGFPNFEVPAWFVSLAPAKTPPATLAQLAHWITAAVEAPEVKEKLRVQGLHPSSRCGAELAASLRREFEEAGRIMREANIKGE